MKFLHKSSKLAAFVLGGLLGLGIYGIYGGAHPASAQSVEEKAVGTSSEATKPVTDCFESRIGFSSVARVENVIPEYGYPNVKCSQKTKGVLWYGDPFYGTIPMGEMPQINDHTRGDFANAVVKPRTPQLVYYNMGPNGCESCHNGKIVPYPKSTKPRLIGMHQDIVENSLKLMHGRGELWCLNCHSATHRNHLVDRQGNLVSFNQPQKLCGSCHGSQYIDWRAGVHGKRIGSWETGGKKRWWVCTECHNPHTVSESRFNRLHPEPPPPFPRGMKKADYERLNDGKH